MKQGLKGKIVSGSLWVMLLEVGNQGLQFFKTFYAAKLLLPADFGIVGLAFLVITCLEILSTTGMKEAVIQKQHEVASYLDTVWVVELVKGIGVCLLLYFIAPLLASLSKTSNTELTIDVIRFIGLIFLLQCSVNIGVVYFEKNIQFKKFFIYQFSGTVADVLTSVLLVYYLQSVWGLFYGVLAGNAVRLIISYLLSDYKPRFRYNAGKAKELYKYGKWILGGRIFNFVSLQADSIIVSSFYGLYFLGIYQMAFRIGNLPMSQVSNLIGRIAFPTFSKLASDEVKLKEFFLTSFSLFTVLIMPIIILVYGLIYDFTVLFLGEKWLEIVPIVKLLILSGLLRIFISLLDSLFLALGNSRYSSFIQGSRFLVFLILAVPLGYFFGMWGIALSGTISLVLIFLYFFRLASKRLAITRNEIIVNLIQPLLYGLVVISLLFASKYFYNKESIFLFIGMVVFISIVYFLGGLALNKYTSFKIFDKPISIIKLYTAK
jgi:O-antigen/teichoic acid export membrane protein